jgi:E3 ubiquitin-protein ligase TRIP12
LLQLILGIPIKKNIATLRLIDEQLARSLERLQSYLNARKEIEALPLGPEAKRNKLASLTVGGASLGDLSLDFTVPGHGIELKAGGAGIDVDDENLEEYLTLVLDMTLGSGIAKQIKSLQDG